MEATGGHWRLLEATGDHRRPLEAVGGHWRPLEAIGGNGGGRRRVPRLEACSSLKDQGAEASKREAIEMLKLTCL